MKRSDNVKKTITITAFLIICFILVKHGATYWWNEKIIADYQKDVYHLDAYRILHFLSFPESYVVAYNEGLINYQEKAYQEAETKFEKALQLRHPQDERDCQIRINYALAVVAQIKLTDLTNSEITQEIESLTKAKGVLCEKGCASDDTDGGHNEDAQLLKTVIDQLIRQLENAKPREKEPEPQEGEEQSGQNTRDQLKEMQSKANQERQRLESQGEYQANYKKIKNW